MRAAHLYSGVLMLLLFLGSGLYLKLSLPPFDGSLDGTRMMFRASHFYLFLLAAINLLLGCYWQPFTQRAAGRFQLAGSVLLLLAQPVFLLAFVFEPGELMARPFTLLGGFTALIGLLLTLLATLIQRKAD